MVADCHGTPTREPGTGMANLVGVADIETQPRLLDGIAGDVRAEHRTGQIDAVGETFLSASISTRLPRSTPLTSGMMRSTTRACG